MIAHGKQVCAEPKTHKLRRVNGTIGIRLELPNPDYGLPAALAASDAIFAVVG
jgi:hypothetical protein